MKINVWDLIIDVAHEMKRVEKYKEKARKEGRRSKAIVQTEKIAEKYGLRSEGYQFLDLFIGTAYLISINYMMSGTKEAYFDLVIDAFLEHKEKLEAELGYVIEIDRNNPAPSLQPSKEDPNQITLF